MNCPNCGMEINEEQNFCAVCGRLIPSKETQKPKFKIVVLISILFCIILSIVYVCFHLNKEADIVIDNNETIEAESTEEDNIAESPVITQLDMNIEAGSRYEKSHLEFEKKAQEFKDLELNDNGEFKNYINNYETRRDVIVDVVFPNKEEGSALYGSIFPVRYAGLLSSFDKIELYTYKKIADTYNKEYENNDSEESHKYYLKCVSNIKNSEINNVESLEKYINGYDDRKEILRSVVSNKTDDEKFSIWFDEIELYVYKTLLLNMSLTYSEDEINALFAKE